jgi:hypothetical protein
MARQEASLPSKGFRGRDTGPPASDSTWAINLKRAEEEGCDVIRATFIKAIILGLLLINHYAQASVSIPISPGGGREEVAVPTGCPAFSWSSVEGAAGYRLEVFSLVEEVLDHQAATERGNLALSVDIPAPALSWSPSNEEALRPGHSYVWFIKALDEVGGGQWSSGTRFRVDFAAFLSGMDEEVRQKVREYLKTDTELIETIREIKKESDQQASPAVSAVTNEGPAASSLRALEGITNTFYGKDAGKVTSGGYNTFIGSAAGLANTTGLSNVFVGYQAGVANVGGSSNIAIGYQAGEANANGTGNTLVGYKAGELNTASNNTMVGYMAGNSNSTGQFNTFLGYFAGKRNKEGNTNTILGSMAGEYNTNGSFNTFMGNLAGHSNTTASENSFLGNAAGFANTTGEHNVFVGSAAGGLNTTGSYNSFLGRYAGHENTNGSSNTFTGEGAGNLNTTGSFNTFIGREAGYNNTTASYNTFLGRWAGHANTTGESNTFGGHYSGYSNTTGSFNTFLGRLAGYSNSTGSSNTFTGQYAGYGNITGVSNTFVGRSSGYGNTSGSYNTFVGRWSGYSNATGHKNVFLGYQAGYNETGSNKLYIHNSDLPDPLIYGEFDTRVVKINGGLQLVDVASSSDLDLKRNIRTLEDSLEKITGLRGVSFEWRTEEFPDKGFKAGRHIGLVAQEVERIIPEIVRTDRDGKKSLAYDKLTAVLVEAVKEQQAELNSQRAQIEELKQMVKQLASASSGGASKQISLVFEHH